MKIHKVPTKFPKKKLSHAELERRRLRDHARLEAAWRQMTREVRT